MDSYIGSVAGTAFSIILLYAPLLYNLFKGNIQATIALWNSTAVEVGLANNMVWLFYGVVKLDKDKTKDMIVGSSWGASANLAYLLVIYSHKGQKRRALFVFAFVMLCVIGALILFQKEITHEQNKLLGQIFGFGGNLLLGLAHFIQIKELFEASEQRQLLSAFISVLPGLGFAVNQCFTSFISHRDQKFIMASCGINIICYVLEFLLILKMHFAIKRQSKKVLDRIQSSFIRRGSIDRSSTRRSYGDTSVNSGDIEEGFGLGDMDRSDEIFYDAARTQPSQAVADSVDLGDTELIATNNLGSVFIGDRAVEMDDSAEDPIMMQHGSSAVELDRNTLPESDNTGDATDDSVTIRDATDDSVTEYDSAPEDMGEEGFPDSLAAADGATGIGDVSGQFSVTIVGMVLTEYITVDPAEVQTSLSVLYPWESQLEPNLPDSVMEVQGVGRDDIPDYDNSGRTRKRKKKTSLAELVGMDAGRPHKRLRLEKRLPLEARAQDQASHAPAREDQVVAAAPACRVAAPPARQDQAVTAPPARQDQAVAPPPARRVAAPPARQDQAVTAPPARQDQAVTAPPARQDQAVAPPPARRVAAPPARQDQAVTAPPARQDQAVAPPPARRARTARRVAAPPACQDQAVTPPPARQDQAVTAPPARQDQAVAPPPAHRARRLIPSWMSFRCND